MLRVVLQTNLEMLPSPQKKTAGQTNSDVVVKSPTVLSVNFYDTKDNVKTKRFILYL